MNELIRELAEQAGMTDDKFGLFFAKDSHEEGVDLEKFAELLVRECARVVENKTSAPGYGVAESWCEPEDLLKHFGVAQ